MGLRLVIASAKGGTGRTTTALALAWTWGRAGKRVALVDANLEPVLALVACAPGTKACAWPGVTLHQQESAALDDADVVIVDGPTFSERAARDLLARADALVLTCLADPLALRTLPVATEAIERARERRASLELLGLVVTVFDASSKVQSELVAAIRGEQPELLVEPPVPLTRELADWARSPGSDLPEAARDAYARIARALDEALVRAAPEASVPLLRPKVEARAIEPPRARVAPPELEPPRMRVAPPASRPIGAVPTTAARSGAALAPALAPPVRAEARAHRPRRGVWAWLRRVLAGRESD